MIGVVNIVFFAGKNAHGAELLKQLKSRNIVIKAIFIEKPTIQNSGIQQSGIYRKIKTTIQKYGYISIIRILFRKLRSVMSISSVEEWGNDDYYNKFSDEIVIVDGFNSEYCEKRLKDYNPDIIILSTGRIIRNNIIEIPKIGVLNAHPGLLPEYRGVNVIPWAVFNGDDVGVTVHFVDQRVDTGEICLQEVIQIQEGDTISSLKKKAREVAGVLMAQVIQIIIEHGKVVTKPNVKEDGRQYYKMDKGTLRRTEQKLKRLFSKKAGIEPDK